MKPVPADETLRLSPKSGQQLQTACLPRVRRATCGRLQLNVRRLVQNVSLVKRLSWGPRPPAALARRPRAPPGVTRVRGLCTSPPADPFALLHSPLSDFWWGTCVCPSGALPSFPSWWPRGHWPPGPGRRVPHHAPPPSRGQVGRCQRVGGSRGAGRRFVPEWRVSPRSVLSAHPSRPLTVPKGPDPWCGVPRPQVPAGNGGGLQEGPQVLSGAHRGLGHRGGREVPLATPHRCPVCPAPTSSSYETLVPSEARSLLTAGRPLARVRGSHQTRAHVPSAETAAADRRPHPPCRRSQPPPRPPQYHPRLSRTSPRPHRDPWAAVRSRCPRGALRVPE